MGEGDSTTAIRGLEPSVSFGRFENDLLSWDKWSAFSQNKYLEEVEKCATPGSVKQKKAYFEARNILIAARKAEVSNKEMEASRELSEENGIPEMCGSEVDRCDEEVADENVFGNELSSPDMVEHHEEATDAAMSHEPGEEDVKENLCSDRFTTYKRTEETILRTEASCPLSTDYSNKEVTVLESKSEMCNYHPDANTLEIKEYDNHNGAEKIREQQILKTEHSDCGTDQPSKVKFFVIGPAHTVEENKIGCSSGIDSNIDIFINAPESGKQETIRKSEPSPTMLDQLKLDLVLPSKSPSMIEGDNMELKDIPALEPENIVLDHGCVGKSPNISKDKSAHAQKMKANVEKSTKKIVSAKNQSSVECVKRTRISSSPKSSQMSTPKISKSSAPVVKSAPRSLPTSRVKNTAASAIRKSQDFLKTSGSTTPSIKTASSAPTKKGLDSLSSRVKSISAGASRKPAPTALHMSLNFGSKISGSVSGSTPVNEPRKSLFMEKMGDKDIVKRAFKAFQSMSLPLSRDTNATAKKVVKNKTDLKPSTPILQKEIDRFSKRDVSEKCKRPSNSKTHNPALRSKEDNRKEVKKIAEKTDLKEAAKSSFQSKHKGVMETRTGAQRQNITYKETTRPPLIKEQRLSKSFQDKGSSKS